MTNNNQLQLLSIKVHDTPTEQVYEILNNIGLYPAVQYAKETNDAEVKEILVKLLSGITELLSPDLPLVGASDEETLDTIARDMNLSRLFRERSLFRLYMLLKKKIDDVPFWMYFASPETMENFSTREDFIGWVCQTAKIPRSMVFLRLSAIGRLESLGYSAEEAYDTILSMPYAVTETLRQVAEWSSSGELVQIDSSVIATLAKRYDPVNYDEILGVIRKKELGNGRMGDMDELIERSKPLISELIRDVSSHENPKDAMQSVRQDILLQPEIEYKWNIEHDGLTVRYVPVHIDLSTGDKIEHEPVVVEFLPDIIEQLPKAIRDDLVKRLPIKNRQSIP